MTHTERDWQRLGAAISARRRALGLNQGDKPPSAATWGKIEAARGWPYKPATLAAIARALQWTADSPELVLRGRQPIEAATEPSTEVVDALARIERLLLAHFGEDEPAQDSPRTELTGRADQR